MFKKIYSAYCAVRAFIDRNLASFVSEMTGDIDEWFCETREIDMPPKQYIKMLPEIACHIANHWDGIYSYNAWYVWHEARDKGLLYKGLPVKYRGSYRKVELERVAELYRLGGSEAVKTYNDIMDKQ